MLLPGESQVHDDGKNGSCHNTWSRDHSAEPTRGTRDRWAKLRSLHHLGMLRRY